MTDLSSQTSIKTDEIFLTDEERQPCEVWTRVMGYHRPVASFNIGKKGRTLRAQAFSGMSRQTVGLKKRPRNQPLQGTALLSISCRLCLRILPC